MAFPKDLREFLPALDEGLTGETTPTVDRQLDVELYHGIEWVTESPVRYQFQTWGGRWSPESRLTNGMRPLRSHAVENDVLVMQRRIDPDAPHAVCIHFWNGRYSFYSSAKLDELLANPPST